MDCYIINGSEKNDITFSRGEQKYLSSEGMQDVLRKSKRLANMLKANGVEKIKVYGSSETKTSHILSIIIPKLVDEGLLKEEDVVIDSAFNGRDYGDLANYPREKVKRIKALTDKPSASVLRANLNLENESKVEKKRDYKYRVFDAVSRVVMENTENQPVILVVGEEFLETCQKDPYIHSMIYFGDEKFYIPRFVREPASYDYFGFDPFLAQIKNQAYIGADSLKSTRKFPELTFEKAIFEVPRVNEFGNVSPVYEKYAKQKAKNEANLESEKVNG